MTDHLLELALRNPALARIEALAAISEPVDLRQVAQAHRALGVVLRDDGQVEAAVAHLRSALRHAVALGDAQFEADVRATYGATLVVGGNSRQGLAALSQAMEAAVGLLRGTIQYRRAMCLGIIGQKRAAIDDFEASIDIFREYADRVWLGRALTAVAEARLYQGLIDDALKSLDEARAVLEHDNTSDATWILPIAARLHFLSGDLPRALQIYGEIDVDALGSGRQRAVHALRLSELYLACGLASDAARVLADVDRTMVPPTDAAEFLALLAEVALLEGRWEEAQDASRAGAATLREMGSEAYALQADLTCISAAYWGGDSGDLSARSVRVAEGLDSTGSERAAEAWLMAGRVAPSASRAANIRRAAGYRHHSNQLVRATGWLARAMELGSRRGSALRACSAGLHALDEYRDTVGSSELHAAMTHQGQELARLALRNADQHPRTLLLWSERWRATSLAQAPVTPHGEVSPALARLRDSGRRIAEARAAGESTEILEKERRTLERKVRAEHHQRRAEGNARTKRFDPAELVAQVADGAFVELVDVDGILHVLVVSKGRVRRVIAGETKAALELAEAGRFALRRAARTNRYAPGDLGQRFQDAVLGKAVRMLPDSPVTISPTAALHGAPFALMPALATRPFSIVPSAAQWLRAREVPTPRTKRRAFVSGPNLVTGGAEVGRLAAAYPDATILRDGDATVEATMKAIDGAKLAHLATHGIFRADSPLFSALEMADGQLSVYELERLKRAPYRTILSACDSGVLAPVGAQEVLGLASALFSLGSAGLVCSIAEVNDEATADLMMRVHASLDAKRTPAEALAEVRAEGSPVEQATAAAFVALGV